jgi:hypothetical protein
MSLGLSHSLSRYKLKFSPEKVDTMIVQVSHLAVADGALAVADAACMHVLLLLLLLLLFMLMQQSVSLLLLLLLLRQLACLTTWTRSSTLTP